MEKYLIEMTLVSSEKDHAITKVFMAHGFPSIEEVYEIFTQDVLEKIRTYMFVQFEHLRVTNVYPMEVIMKELENQIYALDLRDGFSTTFSGVFLKDNYGKVILNFDPELDIWDLPEHLFFLDIYTSPEEYKKYLLSSHDIHCILSTTMGAVENVKSAAHIITMPPSITNILSVIEDVKNKHVIPLIYDLPITKMLEAVEEIYKQLSWNQDIKMFYIGQTGKKSKRCMIQKIVLSEGDIGLMNVPLLEHVLTFD